MLLRQKKTIYPVDNQTGTRELALTYFLAIADQANVNFPIVLSLEPKEDLSQKKLQNETPARMKKFLTGGGLLLLFLLCSKVNNLTTVDFIAMLFVAVM